MHRRKAASAGFSAPTMCRCFSGDVRALPWVAAVGTCSEARRGECGAAYRGLFAMISERRRQLAARRHTCPLRISDFCLAGQAAAAQGHGVETAGMGDRRWPAKATAPSRLDSAAFVVAMVCASKWTAPPATWRRRDQPRSHRRVVEPFKIECRVEPSVPSRRARAGLHVGLLPRGRGATAGCHPGQVAEVSVQRHLMNPLALVTCIVGNTTCAVRTSGEKPGLAGYELDATSIMLVSVLVYRSMLFVCS